MKVDAQGFVTARATVVEFRPPTYPLAFDVAERDGGGRFVVHPDDLDKVKPYEGVTVRFYPADQFARVVLPQLPPLPWERVDPKPWPVTPIDYEGAILDEQDFEGRE